MYSLYLKNIFIYRFVPNLGPSPLIYALLLLYDKNKNI